MGLIKVDYDRAYRQAQRLREAAENCEDACRQVDAVLSQAPSYWRGEAEVQFESELRMWKKEQQAIQRELRSLAETIRFVAEEFEETEKRLAAQAAGQTSGGGGTGAFGGGGSGGGGAR